MDFDEYEYLERAVEVAEPAKDSNGVKDTSVSKRKSDEDSHRQDDDRSRKPRSRSDGHDRHDRSDGHDRHDRVEGGRSSDRDRRSHYEDKDRERPDRRGGDRGYDRERFERPFRGGFRGRDRRGERGFRHMDRDFDRDRDGGRFRDRPYSRNVDFEFNPENEKDQREHGGHRSNKEKKEKKEESAAAEPEADPERDQRTVFAFQISLKADERDVYEFFSRAGKVRDVRLIMDRNSRRSKGVGYIEFYDAMSVPMAIAMTGQLLLGQPVMVKPSEAEKNLVQSTAGVAAGVGGMTGPYSGNARRLYVGNLHYNITEDQLRQVFEPFGPVDLVQLPPDPETGLSKGYGFVQYVKLEDARSAQQALNGILELAGRVMKVMVVTDQAGMQEMGVTPGELDDDEGGGLSLTAQSRAALMQKLDRSGTVSSFNAASIAPSHSLLPGVPSLPAISPLVQSSILGQVGMPGSMGMHNSAIAAAAVPMIGAPTDCLQLKNMFDPSTETEPDFDLDIKDEVQTECGKFGHIKHIFVDKNSAGHVYIRFDNVNSATNAQRALHGRWFAGKMLTATFLTPREYEARFPESI